MKITKTSLVLGATIAISLLYYLVGNPSFYERYLGSFTEGGTFGFLAPSLYQFAVTLILFFFLPYLLIKNFFHEKPTAYGWQTGDRRAGWLVLTWGIPLVLLMAWFASGQAEFRDQYPLFISRLSDFPLKGQNITVFILYEFTYIFYYIGWEFFFRGFALFGLKDSMGITGALIFQAVISTLLHVSKPMPELAMALPGGIIFGLVALRCRSLRSVIIAHWLLGCSVDLFILLR
ncbi:MAG: CPBP family intramembrane metalloprotease [Candidatus Euphemobacter frigidus]|nr:CPBP family intramembrane metalloprotease [Candidatus Euphemobacter frigidus]MDP8276235.1 CPBP family intramembrane metalloprotease [Candidatus Euphemobacter frigidus]